MGLIARKLSGVERGYERELDFGNGKEDRDWRTNGLKNKSSSLPLPKDGYGRGCTSFEVSERECYPTHSA